jgi:hypothetical protein
MKRLLIPAALACLAASGLRAAPITYDWIGTVKEVAPNSFGISVGEPIAITLTLDGAAADFNPAPDRGRYASGPVEPPIVLSVNIGGITDVGVVQSVDVLDNIGGVDMFEVQTATQLVDRGFRFTFQTADTSVLTGDGIPLSIDPANFTTATFEVFRVHGFGTIDALATSVIPEPGSLMLLASGLLGLAIMRNRRSRIW